ncbi:MAG: hypothetical protein AAF289_01060 [Cyanobacteria bacterium P01_A01_bin.135]
MEPHPPIDPEVRMFAQHTLQPLGWLTAARARLPVDAAEEPLPWWTYPAIEFIATWVRPEMRVFEYGGGHSTLWWAERVQQVITVDHDQNWVTKVAGRLSSPHQITCVAANRRSRDAQTAIAPYRDYFDRSPRTNFPYDATRITQRGLNDADFLGYVDTINQQPGLFDCIVIDGMARRLCAHAAVPKLKADGIILFDNSNRSDYLEGYQHLTRCGFAQIRLWGSVPGATFPSCSSIFLRDVRALPQLDFQPSLFDFPEY